MQSFPRLGAALAVVAALRSSADQGWIQGTLMKRHSIGVRPVRRHPITTGARSRAA